MGNKKVSFLIPTLKGGGAERVIVNLANEFALKGNHVELVTLNPYGEYKSQVSERVKIIDLGSSRAIFSIFPLIRYVKQHKPDAIISALDYFNIISLLAKMCTNTNTKFIVTEHSTLSLSFQNNKTIVMSLLPKLMKLLYPFADNIIAVSNGVADDLIKKIRISPGKVKVIYNPVLSNQIEKIALESVDCDWLTAKTHPVILAVGRLTEAKDFTTLIYAFKKVSEQLPAKLIILGEGEQRNHLEGLVNELNLESQVQLRGFVENPYSYMKNADLFVLSSKWEGLPTVLIEALCIGKKIISTDCKSGPREILSNGKYGTLVPVGDASKLADEIIFNIDSSFSFEPKEELEDYLKKFKAEQVAEEYYNFIF